MINPPESSHLFPDLNPSSGESELNILDNHDNFPVEHLDQVEHIENPQPGPSRHVEYM